MNGSIASMSIWGGCVIILATLSLCIRLAQKRKISLGEFFDILWLLYAPTWWTKWRQRVVYYLFPLPCHIQNWYEYDKHGNCLNHLQQTMLFQPRLLQQRMKKNHRIHLILIRYQMDPNNPVMCHKSFWAYYERGMEKQYSFPPLSLWTYWYPGSMPMTKLKPPQAIVVERYSDFPIPHHKPDQINQPDSLTTLQMTRGPQLLPLLSNDLIKNNQHSKHPHQWPIQYVIHYLWKIPIPLRDISNVTCIETLAHKKTRSTSLWLRQKKNIKFIPKY